MNHPKPLLHKSRIRRILVPICIIGGALGAFFIIGDHTDLQPTRTLQKWVTQVVSSLYSGTESPTGEVLQDTPTPEAEPTAEPTEAPNLQFKVVPQLIGMTMDQAIELLGQASLAYQIHFVSQVGAANNTVIAQSVDPGTVWNDPNPIMLDVASDDVVQIRLFQGGVPILKASDFKSMLDSYGIRWESFETLLEGIPKGMVSSIDSNEGYMDPGNEVFTFSRHSTKFIHFVVSMGSSTEGYIRLTHGRPNVEPLSDILAALQANGTPYSIRRYYDEYNPSGSILWMNSLTAGDVVCMTNTDYAFYVKIGCRNRVYIDVSLGSFPVSKYTYISDVGLNSRWVSSVSTVIARMKAAHAAYAIEYLFMDEFPNGTIHTFRCDDIIGLWELNSRKYVKNNLTSPVTLVVSAGHSSDYLQVDVNADSNQIVPRLQANGIPYIEAYETSPDAPAGRIIRIQFSNTGDTVQVQGITYLRIVHSGSITVVYSSGPPTPTQTVEATPSPTTTPEPPAS